MNSQLRKGLPASAVTVSEHPERKEGCSVERCSIFVTITSFLQELGTQARAIIAGKRELYILLLRNIKHDYIHE
jgi:hypothetical protein